MWPGQPTATWPRKFFPLNQGKEFKRNRFYRGIILPPTRPTTSTGRLPDEGKFPGDVIIRNGVFQRGKTIFEVVVLDASSKRYGFELQSFPYAPPGNEQSAVWTQVRRFRPDWAFIGGGGVGQPVSIKEAIRNGISPDRIATWVWLSELDMDVVGRAEAEAVLKFAATEQGGDAKVIKDIVAEVVEKGKGAGAKEKVGTSYYNVGVWRRRSRWRVSARLSKRSPTGRSAVNG